MKKFSQRLIAATLAIVPLAGAVPAAHAQQNNYELLNTKLVDARPLDWTTKYEVQIPESAVVSKIRVSLKDGDFRKGNAVLHTHGNFRGGLSSKDGGIWGLDAQWSDTDDDGRNDTVTMVPVDGTHSGVQGVVEVANGAVDIKDDRFYLQLPTGQRDISQVEFTVWGHAPEGNWIGFDPLDDLDYEEVHWTVEDQQNTP